MTHYPIEDSVENYDENEIFPDNVKSLEEAVVGHKIVNVEPNVEVRSSDHSYYREKATVLTLDNGTKVQLIDTDDCCAYTELEKFLLHVDRVDHIITGVGTTEGFTHWHIYADMGDVLELTVGWSPGSGYYAYGFYIRVVELEK